ncbi:MAG: ribosomal-processing cysteine protease Prp [Treponema sp.]|nr:ribosomal-processing cysteine protease Prp [Treponema sp.]
MTHVVLTCSYDGRLRELCASGHAGHGKTGHDIVCAAESFLLRTVIDVLESGGDALLLEKDLSRRGELRLKVADYGKSAVERLSCVADFVRKGMQSLSEDYPESVSFKEVRE